MSTAHRSQPTIPPAPHTDGKWRVAVVDYYREEGKRGHGTQYAFKGLPGVEIIAACDPHEQSRLLIQQETEATHAYASWKKMLSMEKPDILCVCSRLPEQHKDIIIAAAQIGCHVYCEKPLAASLSDTDEIIEAAKSNGSKIAVAHLARYSAVFQKAREMILQGAIGTPLYALCRGKEDERGGGEDMIVLGTHLLDLTHFFFGPPQWVMADITNDGNPVTLADAKDPSEPVGLVAGDNVSALYGFKNNVRATFESRKGLHKQEDPFRMGIVIGGSEATLSVRFDDKRELMLRSGGRPLEEGGNFHPVAVEPLPEPTGTASLTLPVSKSQGMARYFAQANRQGALDLLNAIHEDRPPLSDATDARTALEMIHGAYISQLEGRKIPLPLTNRNHPLETP